MRPSRQSRHLSAWTTPSAYQQDPAFTDYIPPLELHDTNFSTAGNHLILHHLDFYLLTHNQLMIKTYLDKQFEFWSTMSETIQILQWKLNTFTLHLQGDWLSEPATRRIMEETADSFRQIFHVQQEENRMDLPKPVPSTGTYFYTFGGGCETSSTLYPQFGPQTQPELTEKNARAGLFISFLN